MQSQTNNGNSQLIIDKFVIIDEIKNVQVMRNFKKIMQKINKLNN